MRTVSLLLPMLLAAMPMVQVETTPDLIPTVIVQEVEELAPEIPNAFYLTEEEKDLVERIVFAESGGEPTIESEMAVAQVIRDRAELWGKSIQDVLFAPSQFGKPNFTIVVPNRTKEAVHRVFDLGERVFTEPTTHFYNPDLCSPSWAETKVSRGDIANHRFMY